MDIVTHGMVGASLAAAASRPPGMRRAAAIGFLAGLAADADALIRSSSDPLLTLEWHRHFTHALPFVPIGAALVALMLWPWARRRMPPATLYRSCFAGYCCSGLLDSMTSYGTHLLWPFDDGRIEFSIIAIVDPLFSGALLAGLVVALCSKVRRPLLIALTSCLLYLCLGAWQQHRATTAISEWAQQRGHRPEGLLVKPTLGNLLLWRSVYRQQERFQVDAIRVGWNRTHYPGGSVTAYTPAPALSAAQQRLIQRFAHLSDDYLVTHPDHPNVVGDIRYAMEPTSVRPLWGLDLSVPAAPTFVTFRKPTEIERLRLWHMLRGVPLPEGPPHLHLDHP